MNFSEFLKQRKAKFFESGEFSQTSNFTYHKLANQVNGLACFDESEEVNGVVIFFVINLKTKHSYSAQTFLNEFNDFQEESFSTLLDLQLVATSFAFFATNSQAQLEASIKIVEESTNLYDAVTREIEKEKEICDILQEIAITPAGDKQCELRNHLNHNYGIPFEDIHDYVAVIKSEQEPPKAQLSLVTNS